jgi:hypothetical protein
MSHIAATAGHLKVGKHGNSSQVQEVTAVYVTTQHSTTGQHRLHMQNRAM